MALVGIEQFPSTEAAVADGWNEGVARRYLAPHGIFLRMRLGCFGVWDRGLPFEQPEHASWWSAQYKYAPYLWDILGIYLAYDMQRRQGDAHALSDETSEPNWTTDTDIANGDPSALAHVLSHVEDDFKHFMASKCEPPYVIPFGALSKLPPQPNPRCTPLLDADKDPSRVPGRLVPTALPWWVYALALYVFLDGKEQR
jgi:hypothetical protein